jgi:ribosomal protein S18 acetylase RimI-like enzyme
MTGDRGGTGPDGVARVSLRAATPADAALVLALTLAAYEEYRGALVPESGVFGETLALVRSQIAGRPPAAGRSRGEAVGHALAASGAVVASVGGVAVGCARWAIRTDEAPGAPAYLYVGRVAVVPEQRRRGIASALMAWCEDLATRRGLREVRLGVRLSLPRNEALYRRLGYRPTGALESREGYGPIAAWMSKRIDRPA